MGWQNADTDLKRPTSNHLQFRQVGYNTRFDRHATERHVHATDLCDNIAAILAGGLQRAG
jgi:hypothetical protein